MENKIMELLYELKKKFIVNDDAFMTEIKLTPAEYFTFIAISNCEVINSNLLADKMGLSLSRISRVVDKMVVNGYLNRTTNNKDRRAIKLELTQNGQGLMRRILQYRKACEARITQNVSADEFEQIKKSLNTVLELL